MKHASTSSRQRRPMLAENAVSHHLQLGRRRFTGLQLLFTFNVAFFQLLLFGLGCLLLFGLGLIICIFFTGIFLFFFFFLFFLFFVFFRKPFPLSHPDPGVNARLLEDTIAPRILVCLVLKRMVSLVRIPFSVNRTNQSTRECD